MVELLAGAFSIVKEQLARGKLYSIDRLILPEPVHYFLSTV